MGALLRLSLLLIVLILCGGSALAWYGLSEHPRVIQGTALSTQDGTRAERIIAQLIPAQPSGDSHYQLYLSQPDLNLVSQYLLQRYAAHAVFAIETRHAYLDATVTLPGLPWRPYINISLVLRETGGGPQLVALRIGRIVIPENLAWRLLGTLARHLELRPGISLAAIIVTDIRLRPGMLGLRYAWQPELLMAER